MSLFATLFPLLCWFAYSLVVPLVARRRPSLSVIMSMQRRRWVANATRRDSPVDAILSANLMGSVSFLASTSVLLVLAIFTTFGQLPALQATVANIGLGTTYSTTDLQLHLLVMLVIFVFAFFAFTLALRQFNHFCIMLGALARSGVGEAEIAAIASLNTLAAKNFNNGIRAYYFSIASVAWFASEWAAIAAALITVGFLVHREFFSTAHRVAASAAVFASRRDREPGR